MQKIAIIRSHMSYWVGVCDKPKKQLKAMQVYNPNQLELVGTLKDKKVHKFLLQIHNKYLDKHIIGSWFFLQKNDLFDIKNWDSFSAIEAEQTPDEEFTNKEPQQTKDESKVKFNKTVLCPKKMTNISAVKRKLDHEHIKLSRNMLDKFNVWLGNRIDRQDNCFNEKQFRAHLKTFLDEGGTEERAGVITHDESGIAYVRNW